MTIDHRAMVETLPFVPWEGDAASGRVSFVGPQAVAHLGYPIEEWLSSSFWDDHLFPDDQAAVVAARARLVANGGSHVIDYRMEHALGHVVWTCETATVETTEGRVVLRGFLVDVTSRKRQEVSLWKREERVRALLRRAPDAMLLTDADGLILNMNDQAESLLDYRSSEVVGSSADHLVPDRLRARFSELRDAFERDPERRSLIDGHDFAVLRSDGSEVPTELSMSLVVGTDGSRQILCSLRDLTARRRATAREADQLHRAELAQVARVATMGELAASIAHELNQPLSAIIANAQAAQRLLVADPPGVTEVMAALADIASDGRRAGDVISSMRQLLLRTEPRQEPVQLSLVVREVVDMLQSEATGRGVAMVAEASKEDVPVVQGDPIQLKQVVLNLLMNGLDAASRGPAGTRLVTVATRQEGQGIEVTVRDNGPGLGPSDPEELFAPFVSNTPGGLGMGLTISRTIVEAHGGKLWAVQNSSNGAVFTARLPLA